ncbi:hypothetical protein CP532_6939 [Ophiocordyceps camponoti-leonardi (nom. inval.)]|nr:hypothetical protein CP532_6939 [Ophiocordyceps camponoti-leonardi (nom. inval.)]
MADEDEAVAAQRASEQARLRKERREAKIKAGGSARLNKISGIGGRIVGESEQFPDPPVEIASETNFGSANVASRDVAPAFSEAQLRQMMMGGSPVSPAARGQDTGTEAEDDPMMKMMAQMMSNFNDPSSSSSSPFPNNFPFPQQGQQQGIKATDRYTLTFRLLHAVLSTSLGIYLSHALSPASSPPFTGTRPDREAQILDFSASAEDDDVLQRRRLTFFWLFATAETLLLSSRFFLDKGRQPPPGLLWSAVGFLPDPLRGYVSVVLRYGQIFMTVRADILACVFVLGVACWCRA